MESAKFRKKTFSAAKKGLKKTFGIRRRLNHDELGGATVTGNRSMLHRLGITAETPFKKLLKGRRKIIARGFLHKKNEGSWERKYCVLCRDRLEIKQVKYGRTNHVIELKEDTFVSKVETYQIGDDDSSLIELDGKELRENVFRIGDLSGNSHALFSCESKADLEFWVITLVEACRAVMKENMSLSDVVVDSSGEQDELTQLLEDLEEYASTADTAEPKVQSRLVRASFVQRWTEKEREHVFQVNKKNEELQKELENKSLELANIKTLKRENERELEREKIKNSELSLKCDELMEKCRAEAFTRNQGRREEEMRITKKIKALNRQSIISPRTEAEHFRLEMEKYKQKLEALQKLLNIDLDNLDWDGSLEEAERKMRDCLELILQGDVSAQQEFDKWDQLVRGHKDYIEREENRWIQWEKENIDKNNEAREELKHKYVPKCFSSGCSVQDIIEAKGISRKAAERIWNNNIFKFLWMTPENIGKIHPAALNNSYVSQGLDIRELRAIYASLPGEFQNDPDGKKKQFKETMRSRLYDLTQKEAKGTLTPAEKLNNAYRTSTLKAQPPATAFPRTRVQRKPKINKNMRDKSAALESFFTAKRQKPRKDSTQIKSPKQQNIETSCVIASNPANAKYFRMQKMGIPDEAIERSMIQDGLDTSLLKNMQHPVNSPDSHVGQRDKWTSDPETVLRVGVATSPSAIVGENNERMDQNSQDTSRQPNLVNEKVMELSNSSLVKKRKKKKKKSTMRGKLADRKSTILSGVSSGYGASRLASKAMSDFSMGEFVHNNSSGRSFATREYAGKLKSSRECMLQQSGVNLAALKNDTVMEDVINAIETEGTFDEVENAICISFGELYDKFLDISDILVGVLLKAKKAKKIKYTGDMLFKGIHDEVKISVV